MSKKKGVKRNFYIQILKIDSYLLRFNLRNLHRITNEMFSFQRKEEWVGNTSWVIDTNLLLDSGHNVWLLLGVIRFVKSELRIFQSKKNIAKKANALSFSFPFMPGHATTQGYGCSLCDCLRLKLLAVSFIHSFYQKMLWNEVCGVFH